MPLQESDTIRLKREARKKGGFYVPAEAKLAFVVRIKGINHIDPKSRKIMQLLRLRQVSTSGSPCSGGIPSSLTHVAVLSPLPSPAADQQRRVRQDQQGHHQHAAPG